MSGRKKLKKSQKELDDREIRESKLELKRIEKLIIRKKKEILKEKARILKEKAIKLCSYHLKIRGLNCDHEHVENEVHNEIHKESNCQFKSMDEFYVWAFNDAKRRLQKVGIFFLNWYGFRTGESMHHQKKCHKT